MPKNAEVIDLSYIQIETETEKAWLFLFDTDGTTAWLPKSACELHKDDHVVTVPVSLVEEKDLDAYAE